MAVHNLAVQSQRFDAAIFGTDARDRFAVINAFGCIFKARPRCRETMVEYERVFRELIGSFEFR